MFDQPLPLRSQRLLTPTQPSGNGSTRCAICVASSGDVPSPRPTVHRASCGVHPTHIHFATPGCSTTDATLPRTGFGVPITIRGESAGAGSSQLLGGGFQTAGGGAGGVGGPVYFKRETYRLRNSDDLDKEMSDYQRSLSEGRLVDSDISRDGLSQSHDSVFSESAGTASSLSITLKNELADVLRKRRKDRQGEVSDEDLGLPLSPITPQRKDRGMNKSEGSLSILSMTSSDMDMDDRSASNASGHNLLHLDSSTSGSIGMNRSDNNMDESGDSSKLSHSAAKHKLAVRPKKKGPTRARTRPRETTLLPATPEVNEESLKLSSTNIADYSPTKEADEQAHSLPYGGIMPIVTTPAVNYGLPVGALSPRSVSKEHLGTGGGVGVGSKLSVSGTDLATATGNSTIYVNKHISKSHEFERNSISSSNTSGDRHLLSVEPINRESQKDDGFFKRILNYSFKKKNKHGSTATEKDAKEDTGGHSASSPKKDDSNTNTSSVYISATDCSAESVPTEQIMKLSLVVGDPGDGGAGELSSYKKVKSGPAARQRVFPKDIYSAEDSNGGLTQQQQQHQQRYSSNVEVNRHSVVSSSLAVTDSGVRKVPLHKSEEYLVSKTRKFSERSVDGGEGDDEGSGDGRRYVSNNGERLKSAKLVMSAAHHHGLPGAYQPQRSSKIPTAATGRTEELAVRNGYPTDSPSKRKTVEKSKSFRTYTDSMSSSNLQAGSGNATGQHQHLPHLQHHHHLPSLPNLSSSLSVGNFSNNFLETEHKFFSMTEDMGTGKNRRVFKDYISNNPADDDADGGDMGGEGRLLACSTSLQKFEINDNNLLNPREEYVDHQPKSIVLTTNTLTPPEPTSILNKSSQNISQIEENIDKLVSSQFVSIIRSSDEGSSNERLDDIGGHTGVPEFMKIQLNRVEPAARPAKSTSTVVLTSSPTPAPPTSPAITSPTGGGGGGHTHEPLPDAIKMRRFSNENIEITESKPPLPPSVVRNSLLLDGAGAPKSPPAFRKLAAGNGTTITTPPTSISTTTVVGVANGGSGDVLGSKRNSMNLSQELSDDRKVILQRRTSVTEEKIKYERRISSSSEDIKFEKKKSNSEEVLEKRASSGGSGGGGGGGGSSSSSSSTDRHYNSGSSSGDELVVLRKKFVTADRVGGEGRDKDGTPELMKVFARRSLKLRSDDDYKVVAGSGGSEGKPSMCSIDSDKENQSSEEKLDKVGVVTVKPQAVTTADLSPVNGTSVGGQQQTGILSSGTATAKTGSGEMVGVKNGVSAGDSTPAVTGESILRKNPSSKPFGVPNRFSNVPTNGQPTSRTTTAPSFIDVRKTLLPSVTQQPAGNNNISNNNNNNGGLLAADCQSPVNNNINNNISNTSNRHTIAAMNQLNTTAGGNGGVLLGNNNVGPTIEAAAAANGELNEFKGILQRRAEWEKRAKEGFK
ncbi:hypothetical protein AND_005242 [Anopheles darlingi]|uniref:Uncharacterized protein n=1 Tax=Anopheles darlingi TaxID=43151 RepID=W5JFA5_ANODA|nr:hypothetical protein AND_005242 [Anopheles darlingi]